MLRSYLSHRLRIPKIPGSLKSLSQLGFQPNLVFDVGAYEGEFVETRC